MNKTIPAVTAFLFAMCVSPLAFAQANAPAKPVSAAEKSVPPEIDAAFAAWDADKNGTLSLAEFRNGWIALRRAGELQARLRTQFHTVDTNKNDAIDAGEYGSLVLIQRAGKSAPPLSTFDTNKDQRLEFGEYLELVQRMAQPASTPAPTPKK